MRPILIALLAFLFASHAAALTLVKDGVATSAIVIPADANASEKSTAGELQLHLEKISGAKLDIVNAPATLKPGTAGIFIGRAADARIDDIIRQKGTDEGSFALIVTINSVSLRGLSPEASRFAASELLEQLGVRWFMPGDLGTVIPNMHTIELNPRITVQVPSFHARWHQGNANEWYGRMRMGGPFFPASHGVHLGAGSSFQEHPEFYSLYHGKRIGAQLCVSNPEVVRRTVAEVKKYFRANPTVPWIGMGPNDGSHFCECENCRALDSGEWDPFSSEPSTTDRYIWFFNQVLKGIEDEFPDKKICFYAYHTYMRPPLKIKADPRIVPALAPISLCRVHGPSNPLCPERQYVSRLIEDWKKAVPEIYDRGYWFNLADPGFPFSMVHKMRDQIPLEKKQGVTGWRVETMMHWGSETPSLYLSARLMWNADADVDAILADFYEKFFGPAAKPMSEYGRIMDETLRDSDFHTGCSFDMPHFYPAKLRDHARKLLDQAAELTRGRENETYAARLKIFRGTFDYLEAFIALMDHHTAVDFVAAKKDLDRLMALREELVSYTPAMISARVSKNYLERFFTTCTAQGYKRVTDGNTLVATFKDEWDFQIDPTRVGMELGWWKPEVAGGNWQRLKTSSSSWSDQGLRYYKGEAWYRQAIDVPKERAGQRLFLWFGGVDEKAQVFVNGKEVGISQGAAMVPFELDATDAVVPGRNMVVVHINNSVVNELGTGGIVAPVMLYAPAGGKDAKLENKRDLGTTFP